MRCSYCNQGPFGDVGDHEAYCDHNPDRALEDPDGPGTNLMGDEGVELTVARRHDGVWELRDEISGAITRSNSFERVALQAICMKLGVKVETWDF